MNEQITTVYACAWCLHEDASVDDIRGHASALHAGTPDVLRITRTEVVELAQSAADWLDSLVDPLDSRRRDELRGVPVTDRWDNQGWTTDIDEYEGTKIGAAISYSPGGRDERETATVLRIIRLDHPLLDHPDYYFETDSRRVWPERDKVAAAGELEQLLGAAPVDPMF